MGDTDNLMKQMRDMYSKMSIPVKRTIDTPEGELGHIIRLKNEILLHKFIERNGPKYGQEYDHDTPIEIAMTPLLYAVHVNFFEGVRILAQRTKDLDYMESDGESCQNAMGFAIVSTDAIKMIDILLKAGANLETAIVTQIQALDQITVKQPPNHTEQSEVITHLVNKMSREGLERLSVHDNIWDQVFLAFLWTRKRRFIVYICTWNDFDSSQLYFIVNGRHIYPCR